MLTELRRAHRTVTPMSQGIWLVANEETDDTYVLIPDEVGESLFDAALLDLELAVYGLELMDEDEMEPEVLSNGIKVWCANINGGSNE